MPRFFLILATLCALPLSRLAAAESGPLKAGAATSNITPNLGGDIVGGFKPFPATHIHDELHARCLVLDNGQSKLALVVCDLLGFHRGVSDEARRLILAETAIPKENVLISATHTHSATSALGSDWYQPDVTLNEYQKFVARRIADGVRRALTNARPAEIGFGTAEAPEHVFNRRWHMRPGTMPANPFGTLDLVKMNPPAGSPNLVEPAGPTDPTVSFLSVRDLDGKPIALYAAYSLHYVGNTGPGHVSADYFAMFCTEMGRLVQGNDADPPFVALLANGTSGDINNISFKVPRSGKPPYEQMRHVAHDVASKVHSAMARVKYDRNLVLESRFKELELGSRRPTEEQLAWAKKTLAAAPEDRQRWDLSAIYADRTTKLNDVPERVATPLQVLRVGPVVIGSMPCEVFCEIGLEFKERSALQPAFLVSIAHGYMGYLPTPRQHDLGGYETWVGTNRLEKDASVKMLDALIEMTRTMQKP